ncbi:hypothetical protein [Winogradskyella helgolandensis]|uniref:hypothetical protein n=1 Tax=Winogradskyella helgolandensis TaxID=2697010 RepID=UPI0015C6B24B|nr:hypothetical protein [Winogradskyella helgolandensis]
MKTRQAISKISLALVLVFSVLFTSCEKEEGFNDTSSDSDHNDIGVIDQGASIQRDFMGKIIDESSMPLSDVSVVIGSKVATTDANGIFMIKNASVNERQAYVTAEKAGFIIGLKTVVPTEGISNVRIMLVAKNLTGSVSSGTNSEVSLGNGAKVKFDGAFKDEDGNAYSGNVDVYMYHLDPAHANVYDVMPGNLQAINNDDDEQLLETYGMLNVELKGDSGQKLNIADGHLAEIHMPLDPAQSGVAPSTIPLWHFDEVNGYWVEDGEADLIGGVYIGDVSHFSWWNCDAPFPTVSFCLNVVDDVNVPISNVKVSLGRAGEVYPRYGFSNANGEICGLIPTNETITLTAYDQCGAVVFSTLIGPFSTDTNYGDIVLSGTVTEVISGNLVNCSNANVTDGYVNLTYGNQEALAEVTSGAFAMNIIKCASINTFSLEGVDYDAFQSTTVLPFNLSTPNVGSIMACSTVTEFISVQVDSDPAEYLLMGLYAYQEGPVGGMFIVSGQSEDGSIGVGGDTTTPGTYTTPDFWVQSSMLDMDYNAPDTLQFTISNFGPIGGYVDMTITGTYTDTSGAVRNLAITIHVLRDS